MQLGEIVLPITDPETEWIRGRALQKMSPTFDHARVQMKLAFALDAWATGKGAVGTEWRFRFAPPGEPVRPLVPDIAFVASGQIGSLSHEDRQVPSFPPTVAVEVLSPGDRADDVEDKIGIYLRAGTALVIVADPRSRTIALHDSSRTNVVAGGENRKASCDAGLCARRRQALHVCSR